MAKATAPETSHAVEVRRVTMTSVVAVGVDEKKRLVTATHQATDDVPVSFLDAYVADARTRWQVVEVDPEVRLHDGPVHHPEHLKRGVSLEQHLHDTGVVEIPGQPGFGAVEGI